MLPWRAFGRLLKRNWSIANTITPVFRLKMPFLLTLKAGTTANAVIRLWAILALNSSNISFSLNFLSLLPVQDQKNTLFERFDRAGKRVLAIDFQKVRAAMDDIGYRGWIQIEGAIPEGKPLLESYQANCKFLRGILA